MNKTSIFMFKRIIKQVLKILKRVASTIVKEEAQLLVKRVQGISLEIASSGAGQAIEKTCMMTMQRSLQRY